jgi:hypothetical protein
MFIIKYLDDYYPSRRLNKRRRRKKPDGYFLFFYLLIVCEKINLNIYCDESEETTLVNCYFNLILYLGIPDVILPDIIDVN